MFVAGGVDDRQARLPVPDRARLDFNRIVCRFPWLR